MLTARQTIDAISHERAVRKGPSIYREKNVRDMDLGPGGIAKVVYFGSNDPFVRDGLLADIKPGDLQLFSDLESGEMFYIMEN